MDQLKELMEIGAEISSFEELTEEALKSISAIKENNYKLSDDLTSNTIRSVGMFMIKLQQELSGKKSVGSTMSKIKKALSALENSDQKIGETRTLFEDDKVRVRAMRVPADYDGEDGDDIPDDILEKMDLFDRVEYKTSRNLPFTEDEDAILRKKLQSYLDKGSVVPAMLQHTIDECERIRKEDGEKEICHFCALKQEELDKFISNNPEKAYIMGAGGDA